MSMFANHINLIKGAKPAQPWTVDKAALKLADEGVINAGTILHLDPAGAVDEEPRWKRGCPAPTQTSAPVPYIAWNADTDFDAVGDSYNMVGAGDGTGTSQQPQVVAICLAQASEIEVAKNGENIIGELSSYAPGDLLVATEDGAIGPATGTEDETVIGVVLSVSTFSHHSSNQGTLRFLSQFLPMLNATLGA